MDLRKCQRCGYDLTGLPEVEGIRTCPECSTSNYPWVIRSAGSRRVLAFWSLCFGLGLIAVTLLCDQLFDSMFAGMMFYGLRASNGLVVIGALSGVIAAQFASRATYNPHPSLRTAGRTAMHTGAWTLGLTVALGALGFLAQFALRHRSGC